MSRPTNDKKGQRIELRLNEIQRIFIERNAYESGVSMSEYVRTLIEKDITNRKGVNDIHV